MVPLYQWKSVFLEQHKTIYMEWKYLCLRMVSLKYNNHILPFLKDSIALINLL